jgi:chromosome segregation ATPase
MVRSTLTKQAEKLSARLAESQAAERSITTKLTSANLTWKTALQNGDADRGPVVGLESKLRDQQYVSAELNRQLADVQSQINAAEQAKQAEAEFVAASAIVVKLRAEHDALYDQVHGGLDRTAEQVGKIVLDLLASIRAENTMRDELSQALAHLAEASQAAGRPVTATQVWEPVLTDGELAPPPTIAGWVQVLNAIRSGDPVALVAALAPIATWSASTDRAAQGQAQREAAELSRAAVQRVIVANQASHADWIGQQAALKRRTGGSVDLRPAAR